MPSMGSSSGGNGGARDRQRNFSVGSNVSSSAHKENRENLSNVSDHLALPVNWNMFSGNTVRYPDQESARRYSRLESLNHNMETCEPEQDTKWHCESLLAQLEQVNLHAEPVLPRPEPQGRLRYQSESLKDAQQRLGRLQHAMSKNSVGVQRNMSENGKRKTERTATSMTAGIGGRSSYNQSGNLAFDVLSNRSFNEQRSPSVREMFLQREHLLASSNEGSEQDPEYSESHTTLQNGLFLEQPAPNAQIQSLQDRVDRLERELQRTNFVCEILVREQRNLTSLLDNVAASTMTSSMDSSNSRAYSNGVDPNSSFTQQQMLLSLNQCCQMLMQLQRDFASVSCCVLSSQQQQQQQRQNSSAAPPSPAAAPTGPNFDFPARERRNTGSDSVRQDPLPTLNNQVPPGTRTNNYWDNFRSYSRQNLLSTGSSKAAAEAEDADGSSLATPPGSGGGHDAENGTRTKRKVNKGQRQVEIGVHSPHADNRALAYGLRSTTQPDVTIRNLNPRIGNDVSAVATTVDVKIAKDTSGLMCSGARPKENRRTLSEPLDSEESDTTARTGAKPQNPSLEQALQETLQQHAGNPRFLAELSQLLKKFDSEPLRPVTLPSLQNVAEEQPQNPLVAAFTAAAYQHEFFTPQLLELFLCSVQQDSDDEGAAALPLKNLALPGEIIGHIRHLLEPFLCEPLAQVQQHIVDLLSKISFQGHPKEASTPTGPNDLAEADQVCENEAVPTQNWNESGRETQAGALDEVPIRLLSGPGQNSWFAEDDFHDN